MLVMRHGVLSTTPLRPTRNIKNLKKFIPNIMTNRLNQNLLGEKTKGRIRSHGFFHGLKTLAIVKTSHIMKKFLILAQKIMQNIPNLKNLQTSTLN